MRLLTILAAALALTACDAGEYWMSDSQRAAVRATEDVVRERVASGQMTEAEGRLVLAQQRADLANQNRMAGAAYFGGRSGVYQPAGGGTVIKY